MLLGILPSYIHTKYPELLDPAVCMGSIASLREEGVTGPYREHSSSWDPGRNTGSMEAVDSGVRNKWDQKKTLPAPTTPIPQSNLISIVRIYMSLLSVV